MYSPVKSFPFYLSLIVVIQHEWDILFNLPLYAKKKTSEKKIDVKSLYIL